MIQKIDHLVITASDPARTLDFYKKLGFSVRDASGRYELFSGDFKINVHILGSELSPHAGSVQPGSADLCFETDDDLEGLKTRLEDDGLQIALGVVERTGVRGKMKSIYLRDPDGNLIELCNYK